MAKKFEIPSHILANLRYRLSPYGTWAHGLTIKRRTGELGRYKLKTYTRNHVCSVLVHMVYYGNFLDQGTHRNGKACIKPRHFINAWTKTTAWSKATKEITSYLTNTLTQSLF